MELSTGIALSGFFIGFGIAVGLFSGIYYTSPRPKIRTKKTVDISHQGITSLAEYFKHYKGSIHEIKALDCSFNGLTSLEGCPQNLEELWCAGNKLETLEGCPPGLLRLDCSSNRLQALQGCPKTVEYLYCSHNKIQTLKGCPPELKGLWCGFNDIQTFDDVSKDTLILYHIPNPTSSTKID